MTGMPRHTCRADDVEQAFAFAERILWKICRGCGSIRFDARELHQPHFSVSSTISLPKSLG